MKSIIEQVDQFIEGIADGSIISIASMVLEKDLHGMAKFSYGNPETDDEIQKHLKILINEVIPKYIKLDTSSKEKTAIEIFDLMMKFRVMGIFRNNPDSLKERDFWKNRCLTLEVDVQGKDRTIEKLADDITKLKVGSSAIR